MLIQRLKSTYKFYLLGTGRIWYQKFLHCTVLQNRLNGGCVAGSKPKRLIHIHNESNAMHLAQFSTRRLSYTELLYRVEKEWG